jgi:hypothetical protein
MNITTTKTITLYRSDIERIIKDRLVQEELASVEMRIELAPDKDGTVPGDGIKITVTVLSVDTKISPPPSNS